MLKDEKTVEFWKLRDAQGFGLFVAALERNEIIYEIIEEEYIWKVVIKGYRI